jgi:hypothetical protein
VDKHWYLEIAIRKNFGDVRKVHSDLIPARGVLSVIRNDFDGAPAFKQSKVMRGFLLRESHRLVATVRHLAVMGALASLYFPLLGWERNTNGRSYQQRNSYPDQ